MNKPDTVHFRLDNVAFPHTFKWRNIYHILVDDGLPCPFTGELFRPILTPFWVAPDQNQILVFARVSMSQAFGIERQTGKVVMILDAPSYPISFVNSSLELFIASVSSFTEKYPFYPDPPDPDECEAVADELKLTLYRIDPPSMSDCSFWSELYWDIAQGDWSTTDITSSEVDWSLYSETPPPWWPHPRFFFQPTLDPIRLTDEQANALIGESDG